MHVLAVFDHPYGAEAHTNAPHARSFSAALLKAATTGLHSAGHTVDVIDLAADGFNPAMPAVDLAAWRRDVAIDPLVIDYQRRLAVADQLVLVHPLWWMTMPAATKGFLDRVLTRGFAFEEPRPGAPLVRTLHKLTAVTVLSSHTTPSALLGPWFGSPSKRSLGRGTFRLIGIRRFTWIGFVNVARKSLARRERLLERTTARFARF